MDLDELLGINLRNPSHRLARILATQDETLVDQLVELRKSSGKSQQDVADAMGISQSAVARIESGDRDPHLSTLRRYAHAVGAVITHTVERYDHDEWSNGESQERLSRIPQSVMADQPAYIQKALSSR